MHQYSVIACAIIYFVGVYGRRAGDWWPDNYPYLDEFDSNKALGSSYKQKKMWDHYFFGEMTVSVEEYTTASETENNRDNSKTVPDCRRVTVFSVRGVLLNGLSVTTNCDPKSKHLEQILYIDGALWHYPNFKIKIDSSGRNVIVVKHKTEEKRMETEEIKKISFCEKTVYDLQGQGSIAKPQKTETVPLNEEADDDCKDLFGESGAFPFKTINTRDRIEDRGWNININQFGVKMYTYTQPFPHFMLLTFMNGFPMTGTGKFYTSALGDVVVTDEAVYFGSDIIVRLSPSDPGLATTVLNNRDGTCTHRQYRVGSQQHMDYGYSTLQSVTVLHEPDQECKDFIEGKLVKEMGKCDMEKVMKEFMDKKVEVVPLSLKSAGGPKLHVFVSKSSQYVLRVGNGNGLDIILLDSGSTPGGRYTLRWLVFLTKGVVIDVMSMSGVPNFLVTKNSIICEKFGMIESYEGSETYAVLSNWDSVVCTRKRFTMVNKDGRLVKQDLFPSEIAVTDEKCSLLKTQMKSDKKYNWGLQDGATILGYTKDEFPDLREYLS